MPETAPVLTIDEIKAKRARLLEETDALVGSIVGRNSANQEVELENQMSAIRKSYEQKVADTETVKKLDVRAEVLGATVEKLRVALETDEKDLAKLRYGLHVLLQEIGSDLEQLEKPNEEDLAHIQKAEQGLADANAQLANAQKAWFFKAGKIETAHAQIKLAEDRIVQTKADVQERIRTRTLSADLKQTLDDYLYISEKAVISLKTTIGDCDEKLRNVKAAKAEGFRRKQQATQDLEKYSLTLATINEELEKEQEALDRMESGTPAYAEQEQLVSDLRSRAEEVRGLHNLALMAIQVEERYIKSFENREQAHLTLRDNHRIWVQNQESSTRNRMVTFNSQLSIMKSMAEQEVAKNIDQVGAEYDIRGDLYSAKAVQATESLRAQLLQAQPERIQAHHEILQSIAEVIQQSRVKDAEFLEQYRQKYGLEDWDQILSSDHS